MSAKRRHAVYANHSVLSIPNINEKMDYKTADLLINTYKEATKRTRGIFVILQLVAIVFFIGYFNHRYTWLRRGIEVYELEKGQYKPDELNIEESLKYYYRIYSKSKELGGDLKFIDFDLVGLEIYIEDLPLLGSIALTIIMTWFFYVNRRESGIITEISKKISDEKDANMIKYLFYGTSFNLVFNTIKSVDDEEVSFAQLMAVKIRRILLFLPAIILSAILIHDIYETFWVETIYKNPEGVKLTVWKYFREEKWTKENSYWALAEIILRILITFPLILYCILQSNALLRFAKKDSLKWKIIQDKFLEIREKE